MKLIKVLILLLGLICCTATGWAMSSTDWIRHPKNPAFLSLQHYYLIVQPKMAEQLTHGQVQMQGYDAIALLPPDQIDWRINPFSSKTWELKWHSLYWLNLYPDGPEKTPLVKQYIRSWIKGPPVSDRTFDDHAAAIRLEGFIFFLTGISHKGVLTRQAHLPELADDPEFLDLMATQMVNDATALEKYMMEDRFQKHNHALFHAQALILLTYVFPDFPNAAEIRDRALKRILDLTQDCFDDDGINAEQSAAYQFYNQTFFLRTYEILKERKLMPVADLTRMQTRLEKALKASLSFIRPDGSIVQIGDSNEIPNGLGNVRQTIQMYIPDTQDPVLRQILANIPVIMPDVQIYEKAGLAFFRRGDRFVSVDFSPKMQTGHGHYDFGSWTYSIGSDHWGIDAGGPYEYRTPKADQFRSSRAHNVPLMGGLEQGYGTGALVHFQDKNDYWELEIEGTVYGNLSDYRRRFVILKSLESMAVLDWADAAQPMEIQSGFATHPTTLATQSTNQVQLRMGKNQLIARVWDPSGDAQIGLLKQEISPNFQQLETTTRVSYQLYQKKPFWHGWMIGQDKPALQKLSSILAGEK